MKYALKIGRWTAMAALLVAVPALAQMYREPQAAPPSGKPPILDQVGLDQKLDQQIPLATKFRDESGRSVALSEFFQPGRPVVMALVYYRCPRLCSEVLNGMVGSLKMVKFDAGRDFEVVIVSIDPNETPAIATEKKASYMARYQRPGTEAGWHFLTGQEADIRAVARTMGYRYAYDPSVQQYAHPSAIMVLTPEGKLAQYFYGIEYSPRDLRLGLVEASHDRIGNVVDQAVLYCFHYDPASGKYSAIVMNVLRLFAAATVLLLGTFMMFMFRRDARSAHQEKGSVATGA